MTIVVATSCGLYLLVLLKEVSGVMLLNRTIRTSPKREISVVIDKTQHLELVALKQVRLKVDVEI